MAEGLAEYQEETGASRIYLNEATLKQMDPSFRGVPVYLDHVESVDYTNIRNEADGYVFESFYNPLDGKHWVKFVVVTKEANEKIAQGWKLSNAYVIPKEGFAPGGIWHGMEYQHQVMNASYEHLAIVKNPRYNESIILTPEKFAEYNKTKSEAHARLVNSNDKKEKGESKMKLNLFKRTKVDNSAELAETLVELPKSKKEMSVTQVVNALDEYYVEEAASEAAGEPLIDVGEEKMTLADLVAAYLALKGDGESEDEVDADLVMEDVELDNADEEEEKPAKKDKETEKKENNNSVKKAAVKAIKNSSQKPVGIIETTEDRLRRGKANY